MLPQLVIDVIFLQCEKDETEHHPKNPAGLFHPNFQKEGAEHSEIWNTHHLHLSTPHRQQRTGKKDYSFGVIDSFLHSRQRSTSLNTTTNAEHEELLPPIGDYLVGCLSRVRVYSSRKINEVRNDAVKFDDLFKATTWPGTIDPNSRGGRGTTGSWMD